LNVLLDFVGCSEVVFPDLCYHRQPLYTAVMGKSQIKSQVQITSPNHKSLAK